MAQSTFDVGRRPYKGTSTENTAAVTPISITTATALVLPAIPSGGGGPLDCLIVIEGTNNCRFTTNGVTPTTTIGQLLVPSNGVISMTLSGQAVISAFKIIAAAGGSAMTYQFYTADTR